MTTLLRCVRYVLLLLLASHRARRPTPAGTIAFAGGSPFLIFQNAFSGEQLAFGPGQLADPEGPQVIVVLSTEALVAGLRTVH